MIKDVVKDVIMDMVEDVVEDAVKDEMNASLEEDREKVMNQREVSLNESLNLTFNGPSPYLAHHH